MIVSFEYNYLYVKTPKTAGTSVEIALSTHVGPRDIVTPLDAHAELVRASNPRAVLPQNYSNDAHIEKEYCSLIRRGDVIAIQKFQDGVIRPIQRLRNHSLLREARDKVAPEFFQKALKVTTERHPYEKAVSLAYFRAKHAPDDISAFLEQIISRGDCNNSRLYRIDGVVAVDFFILYESLHSDLAALGKRIGAHDLVENLPHTKHEFRRDHRPARDILTLEQKQRIREVCRKEFELFGYSR